MNIERMLKLADAVEATDDRNFYMASYFVTIAAGGRKTLIDIPPPVDREMSECGTAACLAGWGIMLFADEETRGKLREKMMYFRINEGVGELPHADLPSIAAIARTVLGLTRAEADFLFMGRFSISPIDKITKEEAAAAVRYMVERHIAGRPTCP